MIALQLQIAAPWRRNEDVSLSVWSVLGLTLLALALTFYVLKKKGQGNDLCSCITA